MGYYNHSLLTGKALLLDQSESLLQNGTCPNPVLLPLLRKKQRAAYCQDRKSWRAGNKDGAFMSSGSMRSAPLMKLTALIYMQS